MPAAVILAVRAKTSITDAVSFNIPVITGWMKIVQECSSRLLLRTLRNSLLACHCQ